MDERSESASEASVSCTDEWPGPPRPRPHAAPGPPRTDRMTVLAVPWPERVCVSGRGRGARMREGLGGGELAFEELSQARPRHRL